MKKAFILRLNESTFQLLKKEARTKDASMNSYCASLLSEARRSRSLSQEPRLLAVIKNHFKTNLIGVVFFGSRARGTPRAHSDMDLLIVLKSCVPINGKLYREWDELIVSERVSMDFCEVSPHFVHLIEDPEKVGSLWLEIAIEGKIWIDSQNQIELFLQKIRTLIAEGRWVRAYSYGVPYWKG